MADVDVGVGVEWSAVVAGAVLPHLSRYVSR